MSTPADGTGAACAAPCADPILSVRGLRKVFGPLTAVRGVDMDVCPGEIFGFLGPNGSGKTTTMRMLCGLLVPTAGQGHALGHDILRETRAIRLRVGYMPQRFALYEDLTVRENLLFAARVHGLPQPRQRVEQALDELGLARRAEDLAGHLSGGWKQRLALAACTLHDPRLLLLDEPTAGVDPDARQRFWNHIHELAQRGITVLVSTHYMDEAERCHRLAYFHAGRILACGGIDDIIAHAGLRALEVMADAETAAGLEHTLRRKLPAVQATWLGGRLHVSFPQSEANERAVRALCTRAGAECIPARPRLEDAFIHLLRQARQQQAAALPEEARP